MVHPCIVSFAGVHSNRDGNFLTRPSFGLTLFVAAAEAAHDMCIVTSDTVNVIVDVVEREGMIFGFEQAGQIIV